MKYFTELFQAIDASTKTNDKITALVEYFRKAEDQDKVWAIALLTGNKPKRPVKTTDLRLWASEIAKLPLWLIEESYYVVGDLAETLAHIVGNSDAVKGEEIPLHVVIMQLKDLLTAPIEDKKDFIQTFWLKGNKAENFVFNKLITGNFRIGLSKQSVIRALSIYLEKEEKEIAHRLMGKWNPAKETMNSLFSEESLVSKDYLPYPFFLAYPLEESPSSFLGDINDWFLEKKYDGIRGQIIIRNSQVYVWSRGEELLTDKFPEFHILNGYLPDGTVIDGEIIPWKEGTPLPFGIMQTRIGRKNLSAKALAEAPLVMVCYDLMEYEGVDIRHWPLEDRRKKLLELIGSEVLETLLIPSPLVKLDTWEEVAHFRKNAREEFCEGLMIKKKNSPYETGRRRGSWWKWKTDPMTIDGVLIYAQSGSGRRANLLTDYTFAVWDGDLLVPFAKAYSGLKDKEILKLDKWARRNTVEKFGPVRSVKPELVFEIAFEGINKSTRHKSGVALRFPRIARWREDKPAIEANTKDDLVAILNSVHSE
ncbi:ATP-dependent DNA ligase [Albibacterium sp.]|uniref:ATP-dependent DNA ligase n=1 Tax=Albibacterium sp. TaxID=2952885 RepID=UPI002C445039|nr:ATP-dependent DNA ligase [Albibacterium sp.]HUH17959.1 ATP-dependent DNA ligase [Albibacterium sp.]